MYNVNYCDMKQKGFYYFIMAFVLSFGFSRNQPGQIMAMVASNTCILMPKDWR